MSKKATKKSTKKASERPRPSAVKAGTQAATSAEATPRLLSGGNPADPQGPRRCPCPVLHCRHARLEDAMSVTGLDQIITRNRPRR
jgi:hypothetical protein